MQQNYEKEMSQENSPLKEHPRVSMRTRAGDKIELCFSECFSLHLKKEHASLCTGMCDPHASGDPESDMTLNLSMNLAPMHLVSRFWPRVRPKVTKRVLDGPWRLRVSKESSRNYSLFFQLYSPQTCFRNPGWGYPTLHPNITSLHLMDIM